MRLYVLFFLFSLQFCLSQESKTVVDTKLRGKEMMMRRNFVWDSLQIKFDSVANDSKISNLLVLENAEENLGSFYYRTNEKYAFGNYIDLKNIMVFLGYDFLHTTIDDKISGQLFYVFYKGNLSESNQRKTFEKKLFDKLKLEKVVKLQNYTTFHVSIINSLLIKSTERDYKNVYDTKENRLYFSGKINQFINALNGFFPGRIHLVDNSDEENLYDIEVDVSSLEKCIEEMKFLGFVIEEKNQMLEHTFINKKIK